MALHAVLGKVIALFAFILTFMKITFHGEEKLIISESTGVSRLAASEISIF